MSKSDTSKTRAVDEILINCGWDEVNTVLKGWRVVMKDFQEVGILIQKKYVYDHPNYKKYFLEGKMDVEEDDYDKFESFTSHAYAIMKGLNSIMRYLSGNYEDDGEILPVIGRTHRRRGIQKLMFSHLKEAVVSVCCEYLEADKKSKAAWNTVMNFIFNEFLLIAYS